MPLPPELTVEIRRISEGQYLAVTKCVEDGTEVCQNTFGYSPDLLRHMEPQWLLERAVPRHAGEEIRRGPADAGRLDEAERELARYGQELYAFLFGDGTRLRQFLEFNDDYRRGARLTLALHPDAAGLWRLPWEYLHDDAGFLALSGRFLLGRTPLGLGTLSPEPVAPPLRILVVIAAPDDQRPLDTEEEIGVIQQALDDAVRAGRVQVEYLDDATVPAIGDALRRIRPHVFHYTGHGAYDATQGRSFLALEDDDGCTRPAGIADLRPYLADDPDLRLALLSGCQTAITSDVDAFTGVATGLLAAGVPAVLAMQSSILDPSAIELARAFYAAIAEGATPLEAAQRSRLALRDAAGGPGYDWGVPALYLRAANLRLVAMGDGKGERPFAPTRGDVVDVGGLPLPAHFVGRKAELRSLRRALRDPHVTAAFVRGIGGMGKSSIAAKLLQRPGIALDGALVIRCNQVAALDIPAKLAAWLAARGVAGHAEAAALLLDSRLDPAGRARQALARLDGKRYLWVFDNFESVMDLSPQHENNASTLGGARRTDSAAANGPQPAACGVEGAAAGAGDGAERYPSFDFTPLSLRSAQDAREISGQDAYAGVAGVGEAAFPVADPTLAGLFEGLLDAPWRGMCLFTGRFRWDALEARIGRDTAVELHLPDLTLSQAVMLMDNLPRLRRQPLATKTAIYRKVGGHPKSIELLEGWLAAGKVTDLLGDPKLDGMLADQWAGYFLDALLAQLSAAERDALTRLCIFDTALDDEEFTYAEIPPAWVTRWLDLSLLQREGGAAPPQVSPQMQGVWELLPEAEKRKLAPPALYTVHPVVREYLLRTTQHLPPPTATAGAEYALHDLHLWAAAYYGRPFVEMARQYTARSGKTWTEEQIESLARDQVVMANVARTDDMPQARAAMGRALAWRDHLFAAGAHDAAGEIVTAVVPVLDRWGQRDRAKALLAQSIATLEGPNRAATQGNLASLLMDEGKLAEALATYEAVYRTFEEAGASQQMAAVLTQIASVYQMQGNFDKAIEYEERSLAIERERDNEEGQAISLHQLSVLYMLKEDYAAALARSGEAEALDRKRGDQAGLAADLHEQGLIYTLLARAAADDAEAGRQRKAAFNRFTESLAIERRIGDEAGTADSLGELGKLLQDAGRMGEAITAFNEYVETQQRLNNPTKLGIGLEWLGSIHERQGQLAAALEKYQQALELKRKYMGPRNVALTEANIARVRGKMGSGGNG